MKLFIWAGTLCLAALSTPESAAANRTSPDLLGIHIGMDDREALRRLKKLGRPITKDGEEEEPQKQHWTLRGRRYGSLVIQFDARSEVLWMTAFARSHRVRYRHIGDLSKARRTGIYIYTWTVPLGRDGRRSGITARGSDPEYISSVSIHPPGPASSGPTRETRADSAR